MPKGITNCQKSNPFVFFIIGKRKEKDSNRFRFGLTGGTDVEI